MTDIAYYLFWFVIVKFNEHIFVSCVNFVQLLPGQTLHVLTQKLFLS